MTVVPIVKFPHNHQAILFKMKLFLMLNDLNFSPL